MAKVYLKQNWYAPDGQMYYGGPSIGSVEIPDHLISKLPSTAVLDDGKARTAKPVVAPMMNIDTKGIARVTHADAERLALEAKKRDTEGAEKLAEVKEKLAEAKDETTEGREALEANVAAGTEPDVSEKAKPEKKVRR